MILSFHGHACVLPYFLYISAPKCFLLKDSFDNNKKYIYKTSIYDIVHRSLAIVITDINTKREDMNRMYVVIFKLKRTNERNNSDNLDKSLKSSSETTQYQK